MNKSLKSIFQNISYLSSVQLVLALTGILRNKILAVKLSEDGFGAFNQVLLFSSLLSTVICLGMNVSLTRNMAVEKSKERQQHLLNNANATIFYLYLVICIPVLLLSIINPAFIFKLIHVPYTTEYHVVLIIALLFLIFDGLKNNLINVLTATLNIGKMAKGRIIAVVIATAVGVPLIFYFYSIGGAIQYTMINILLYVVLFKEVKGLGFKPLSIKFNKVVFKSLFFLGMASLISGSLGQIVDLLIRNQIIKYNGISSNGNYQAALLLSSQLKNILLGSVGSLAVATLGKSTNKNDFKKTINDLLTVIIPIMVIAQGVLIINSKFIIHLLYSNRFSLAIYYLPWILVADFFMTIAWIFGSPLLTLGYKRLWLKIAVIFWAVKLTSTTIALRIEPVYGIVIGGIITNFVHVVINYIVLTRLTEYRLKVSQHMELGGGIVLLLSFSVLLYINSLYVYIASCIFLLMIVVYFVRKLGLNPLKLKSVR